MTTPMSPAPSTAPRARASTSGGNESTASISRISDASARPPAQPAASPSSPPATTAIATEPSPAMSDTRVPQITRDSTSRPTLSVPSRCARLGFARAWPRSCLSGSWGDSTGARSAAAIANTITAAPKGASRARAARFSTTHRLAVPRDDAAGPASAGARSAIPDSRIDEAIEQVHDEVRGDEAHRDQQHHALDQRIVARKHGVHHEPPNAGQGEDVLGDDGAADEGAEL